MNYYKVYNHTDALIDTVWADDEDEACETVSIECGYPIRHLHAVKATPGS